MTRAVLSALSRLNSWARVSFEDRQDMHDAVSAIYAYKRAVIKRAIEAGTAILRIVAVERPCKTCKGTGEFKRWDRYDEDYYEPEDCRRCGATGRVTLRFVESAIFADGDTAAPTAAATPPHAVVWHTPHPKWDLGTFTSTDFDACTTKTAWEPEQPGQPLALPDLIAAFNTVERYLLTPGKLINYDPWSPYRDRNWPHYTLSLGTINTCWICDAPTNAQYAWAIHRPGLMWRQTLCDRCRESFAWTSRPYAWPRNLDYREYPDRSFPEWSERVPLPPLATTRAVTDWLARRGIVAGYFHPGECAFAADHSFVRVMAVCGEASGVERPLPGVTAFVHQINSDDFYHRADRTEMLAVPADSLYVGRLGSRWHTAAPVEWP